MKNILMGISVFAFESSMRANVDMMKKKYNLGKIFSVATAKHIEISFKKLFDINIEFYADDQHYYMVRSEDLILLCVGNIDKDEVVETIMQDMIACNMLYHYIIGIVLNDKKIISKYNCNPDEFFALAKQCSAGIQLAKKHNEEVMNKVRI